MATKAMSEFLPKGLINRLDARFDSETMQEFNKKVAQFPNVFNRAWERMQEDIRIAESLEIEHIERIRLKLDHYDKGLVGAKDSIHRIVNQIQEWLIDPRRIATMNNKDILDVLETDPQLYEF